MLKNREEIVKKYNNTILGFNSSIAYPKRYFVEEFLNKKQLVRFLSDLVDHETTITKSGFKFLEEYYGIDYIVDLLKREEPDFPYDDSKRVTPKEYLYMKAEYAIDV